jgi:hypothetical protein
MSVCVRAPARLSLHPPSCQILNFMKLSTTLIIITTIIIIIIIIIIM